MYQDPLTVYLQGRILEICRPELALSPADRAQMDVCRSVLINALFALSRPAPDDPREDLTEESLQLVVRMAREMGRIGLRVLLRTEAREG